MSAPMPHDETKINDKPSSSSGASFASRRESVSEDETAALRELKKKLQNVPQTKKSSLVHVQRVRPELVNDEHMLRFLRVECFNIDLALKRLVMYWEERYKVFGPDKYALPMTLNGAMKDSIDVLRMGFSNLLPVLDEAGRAIIYLASSPYRIHPHPPTEHMIRVWWYLVHLALEMPGTAKNGYITLFNTSDLRMNHFNRNYMKAIFSSDCSIPIRWKVSHVCHTNPMVPILQELAKACMTQGQRESYLIHNCSESMVAESLAKYHLPAHSIPTDLGGTLQMSMEEFIQERLIIEEGTMAEIKEVEDSLKSTTDGLDNCNCSVGKVVPEKQGVSDEPADNPKPSSASTESSPTDKKVPAQEHNKKSSHRKRKSDGSNPVPSKKHPGRSGDPRMKQAVEARLQQPDLSLLEALIAGGFVFPGLDESVSNVGDVLDTDGVSVYQRRNQLMRRLRILKKKAG